MTFAEFCTKHGIQLVSTRTLRNPHMHEADGEGFTRGMAHWHVMLTYAAPEPGSEFRSLRSMKLHFSKGSGHNGAPPTAAEVIESLASDARSLGVNCNGVTFKEWCAEYGLDNDSITALRSFQAAQSLSKRLKQTLGPAVFAELLSEVE